MFPWRIDRPSIHRRSDMPIIMRNRVLLTLHQEDSCKCARACRRSELRRISCFLAARPCGLAVQGSLPLDASRLLRFSDSELMPSVLLHAGPQASLVVTCMWDRTRHVDPSQGAQASSGWVFSCDANGFFLLHAMQVGRLFY